MQTLSKSTIFFFLDINLKFPAAGVHQPFIPMTDKTFQKQIPKHTTRTHCFISLFLCPEFYMSMITANRLACHDIAIATVAMDYAYIGMFRISNTLHDLKGHFLTR